MSKEIIKRLSSENSQRAINQDVIQKVNLEGEERLLPSGEINHVLDIGDQFDKERQESPKYRFIGSINPIMSNVLFNLNGTTTYGNAGWAVFGNPEFVDDPYDNDETGIPTLSFSESYTKYLKEVNGWFGYFDPDISKTDSLCTFFDMEPKRTRFSLTKQNIGVQKWVIKLSYPESIDDTDDLVVGGLKIIKNENAEVSKRDMTALTTVVNHNLGLNDEVRITGLGGGLDGDYRVIRTGLDDGDRKESTFVIDIDPASVTSVSSARVKKVINGNESKYYFRKFKMIDVDYDSYEVDLARTIYDDVTNQLVFNDDFNVDGLTDNLGRPLSEVYISILKTDDNGFFTSIKSGIETPYLNEILNDNSIPCINKIHNPNGGDPASHRELETVITTLDELYGDVVEYNDSTLKETILNEIYHRFNTTDRNAGGLGGASRYEGYYYKPHYRMPIRYFSSYIEQGDDSVVGIPDYALDLGDGRFLWRDFLNIGIPNAEGEVANYPFSNGAHYIYNNIDFCVRRQDPFGYYGLYYASTEPIDIGGAGYLDVYSIKSTDNIC